MRTFLLLCLALLAGCAQLAPAATPSPSESPEMDPTSTPRPSIDVSLAPSTSKPRPGGEEITGTLGADSIEGGCTYLEAEDRTRYEVIYPDGWRVQAAPLQLANPEGEVVATGGETITVRGRRADDMASICQIGPIFRANEVVDIGS